MKRLAPLFAYIPWHARDSLMRALAPAILATGVIGIPVYAFLGASEQVSASDPRGADIALNIYNSGITLALVLGSIILVNQVVALDREKQHFRFTLAHPVAAWEFYLQRFIVSLVLFVAVCTLIPVVFSALVLDVNVLAVAQSAALYGLLLGALAMLCGVLFAKDGLVLIIMFVVTNVMQDLAKADALASWLEPIARALPPLDRLAALRGDWMRGIRGDSGDVLYVVIYGAGMLALSLFLVKRLPLAR
jgi:hypothetical protein